MSESRRCEHEVNWAHAGLAGTYEDGCDVGLECAKCGEQGFADVEASMIRWNDRDDWGEWDGGPALRIEKRNDRPE
jgi:hypothetical protein